MGVIFGLLCFLSFSAGIGITFLYFQRTRIGKLHVETSDPDGPLLFVELHRTIDFVKTRDIVILEVDTENYISHE